MYIDIYIYIDDICAFKLHMYILSMGSHSSNISSSLPETWLRVSPKLDEHLPHFADNIPIFCGLYYNILISYNIYSISYGGYNSIP